MFKTWEKISNIGLKENLNVDMVRNIVFVNRINAILIFFAFSSILFNILMGSSTFIPVLSSVVSVLLFIYFLHFQGYYHTAHIASMLAGISVLAYMSLKAGIGAGLEFYFLSLLVLPVIIFRNNRTIYFFQVLCILCLIGQKIYYDFYHPQLDVPLIYKVFYIVNSVYSGLLIILAIFFFRNQSLKNEKEIITSNKTIEAKNEELNLANKQLESFIYSVSHDLRSPLRTIEGFSRILLSQHEKNLNDDGKELLQIIATDAARMKLLIEDLLSFSRSGMQEIHFGKIDTDILVQEVLGDLRSNIGQSGTKIELGDLLPCSGDLILIKQVWYNLIANAVKYSSKSTGPVVKISSEKSGNNIIYTVRDNGTGFDMQYESKLFGVFQRLHSSAEFEGTGLGLAIVKNIITRHGGIIWAEAKPGEGAAFFFTLQQSEQ
jgi:two-component system, sensor histidine kinase and response regulator